MNTPSREVHGSSRLLFKVYRNEADYSANASYGGIAIERPTRRVLGELISGQVTEWSPSGEHVNIGNKWYNRTDVEIVEVLP